jgi:hypothetical protein
LVGCLGASASAALATLAGPQELELGDRAGDGFGEKGVELVEGVEGEGEFEEALEGDLTSQFKALEGIDRDASPVGEFLARPAEGEPSGDGSLGDGAEEWAD